MRIQQATLATAVVLSTMTSPVANMLAAVLFAGLIEWARACGSRERLARLRRAAAP